jgi:hypothetical protein
MKKLVLGFAIAVSLSVTAIGQTGNETGNNARSNAAVVLTPSQRTKIAESNAVAVLAAENLNNESGTEVSGASNRRSAAPVIVISRTSRDGVQLFQVQDQETLVAYDVDRNAFIPVRTRQQAARVATDSFEPVDDTIGKKLKKRKANKQGKNAEIFLDVKENRKKLKVQETDEETLAE